jgi:HlyD family secretion protein
MQQRLRVALILATLVAVGVALWWWLSARSDSRQELTLYGNIDLRQIDLPFNGSERVAEVLVQEGDHVKQGQLLARLDTSRLQPQVARAQADLEAQQQMVYRLHRGNRPAEIDQSRANAAAARADAVNAHAQYERLRTLSQNTGGRALSQQDLDSAQAASDAAEAKLNASQKALALELAGPRREDVAQGEAQLQSQQASLAMLQQQLKDAELRAPVDAVVRSRVVEPGEISSPQKTAFTLAIVDPKWVRTYVAETDLGSVREGLRATVSVDAFPKQSFEGWIGFISPSAEFTPKPVETRELRSSLVYEVRVFVKDPEDRLRLGSPATVHLPLAAAPASGGS